jgi:hypothetical protein
MKNIKMVRKRIATAEASSGHRMSSLAAGFGVSATHPVLLDYCADRMGNIYDRKTQMILNGNQQRDGYIRHEFTTCNGMKIQMSAHDFVFECFCFQVESETHYIHHKNGVHNCNELSNLELLNKRSQACITRAQRWMIIEQS